tara:strand:- start:216 stop:413 length:198 start_codon:yes stop_codon:yes gene_type:complete
MYKLKLDSELLMKAAAHASQRGMTLEEYLEEFTQMLGQKIRQENADIQADLILTKQKINETHKKP